MKKLILIITVLTIVSCNRHVTYEETVNHAKEMNQCMLDELIAGHDSTVACIICNEKLK